MQETTILYAISLYLQVELGRTVRDFAKVLSVVVSVILPERCAAVKP